MGMKLYIAADAIAKGLDPTVPHCTLGPDGMFAVPSVAVAKGLDPTVPLHHPVSDDMIETPKQQSQISAVISEPKTFSNPETVVPGAEIPSSISETPAVVEPMKIAEVKTVEVPTFLLQNSLGDAELSPEATDAISTSEPEKAPNPNIIAKVADLGLVSEIEAVKPSMIQSSTVVEVPKVLPVKPTGRQPKASKPVS